MISAYAIPFSSVTDTTVLKRARELAVVKGRNPLDTSESDLDLARRELTAAAGAPKNKMTGGPAAAF